jgi:hypothetical protein
MDGDFSTEALKTKQRTDIRLEFIVPEGGGTSGCPRLSSVAHDVVLELVDDEFLLGDDVFHQVADGGRSSARSRVR